MEAEVAPDLVLRDAVIELNDGWSLNRLVSLLKRILHLPRVTQIGITPENVFVSRVVAPGEEVIPASLDQTKLPFEALLSKPIEAVLRSDDKRFIPKFQRACAMLEEKGYRPSLIIAPTDPNKLLNALPMKTEGVITQLFGIPVQYDLGPEYHSQIILFGGETHLYDDIEVGITMDTEWV